MSTRNRIENFNRINCTRCGNPHGGLCFAFKATCNKCNKIGHYARVCRSTLENKQKSYKTKQRDTDRMTSFLRRKIFECQLPFYCVDNDYLKLNEINAVSVLHTEINSLKNHMALMEFENDIIARKNEAYKNDIQLLEEHNKRLKTENENLSKLHSQSLTQLEETSLQVKTKTEEVNRQKRRLTEAAVLIDSFLEQNSVFVKVNKDLELINDAILCLPLEDSIFNHVQYVFEMKENYESDLKSLKSKVSDLEKTNEELTEKLDYFQNQQDQRPRNHKCQQNDRRYGGPRNYNEHQQYGYNSKHSGRKN